MIEHMLNEHQRRHFHVLLSLLGQSSARLEALAVTSAPESPLLSYQEDLPERFGARISPHLAALRSTLARLAGELHLVPKQVSRRNTVRAILVTEIVRLEDSMARGLRGYGEVDSRVKESIDPILHEMVGQLRAMKAELERREP